MQVVFQLPPCPVLPIVGSTQHYTVRRIFCVGRNYAEHAREMGASGEEAPFFFMKPATSLLSAATAQPQSLPLPYPPDCTNFHHELELVVALGNTQTLQRQGWQEVGDSALLESIYGYALGLDMTRRDLQSQLKAQGKSWEAAKAFEASAPVGALTPTTLCGHAPLHSAMQLHIQQQGKSDVNLRQQGNPQDMVATVPQLLRALARTWDLNAGDIIFTGTPAGVAAVQRGDLLKASMPGLADLTTFVV